MAAELPEDHEERVLAVNMALALIERKPDILEVGAGHEGFVELARGIRNFLRWG